MTTKNNIPAGYKDSAVGIIPQEWEVKRLGLVCNFLDNQRVPIKDVDRLGMHGPYPYYGASGIIDYVNDYIFDDELILLGEDGANIINRSTPLAFMVEGKIWVNNHAHVLRPIEPNNRFYICSYLESISYDKYNTGTAQPKLNREVCEKILIPVPPMEEQRKIAEILGVWDEAIEKQSRLIEKLELRKRALMQRLLTGRTRLPGFTTPWQKVKLGEIAQIKKGVQVNKDTLQEYGKYPTINGGIEPSGYSDNYNTEANTITISEGGNSCGYVNFITTKFWSGGHCYTIIPNDNVIKPYLFQQLKHLEPHIMHLRVGSGLPNIQLKTLTKLRCSLPSLPEQKAIAEVLTAVDNEIATHRKKLDALRLQKRGLMQQLLTGKTRVKI